MTQTKNSPLNSQLFRLEYPRSLGTYSTYAEVQAVVDTLADRQFPVQHTLIVGTDLKLMERVTGRQSWGRVILSGVLSGVWMGLFIGILFALFTSQPLVTVISTVLMGIVFFTIWSVIGYALSGGKRDFTSMTSTIPMQYELLVEHRHAEEARRLLVEEGAAQAGPAPLPHSSLPPQGAQSDGRFGAATAGQRGAQPQHGAPTQVPPHPQHERPTRFDQPPVDQQDRHPSKGRYGAPAPEQPAEDTAAERPRRPSYGRPASDSEQSPQPVQDQRD